MIQCNDRLSWVGRKTKDRARSELLPLYILYRVFVRAFTVGIGVEREGDDVSRRTDGKFGVKTISRRSIQSS